MKDSSKIFLLFYRAQELVLGLFKMLNKNSACWSINVAFYIKFTAVNIIVAVFA